MGTSMSFWPVDEETINQLEAPDLNLDEIEVVLEDCSDEEWDIDKAWDGLNYLFGKGLDEMRLPENFLYWGTEIAIDGEESVFLYYTPEETDLIADYLNTLNRDILHERFVVSEIKPSDFYLADMLARDGEEGFDYLYEYFIVLQEKFNKYAHTGKYILWQRG